MRPWRGQDPKADVLEAAIMWRTLLAQAEREETWSKRAQCKRRAKKHLKALAKAADLLVAPVTQ
jgi:hypothetical protein